MKGKGKDREEDGRSLSSLRSRSSNPLLTGTTFVDYVMIMRTLVILMVVVTYNTHRACYRKKSN